MASKQGRAIATTVSSSLTVEIKATVHNQDISIKDMRLMYSLLEFCCRNKIKVINHPMAVEGV